MATQSKVGEEANVIRSFRGQEGVVCPCGSMPRIGILMKFDGCSTGGLRAARRMCVRIHGYGCRLKTRRKGRRESAIGDAGGLLLDGCNRRIVLSDERGALSRVHNLLEVMTELFKLRLVISSVQGEQSQSLD